MHASVQERSRVVQAAKLDAAERKRLGVLEEPIGLEPQAEGRLGERPVQVEHQPPRVRVGRRLAEPNVEPAAGLRRVAGVSHVAHDAERSLP